jgi:uncharacterized cofD-like protein
MDSILAYILGFVTALIMAVLLRFRERSEFSSFYGSSRKKKAAISRAVEYRLSMGPYVVALGGGTGLSSLLRGLKSFTRNIVAVVTVTDEGGSSGRLREEWGVLPPGDVRNCIVALAENDSALRRLLDFRFDRGVLAGHSLGNLMLLAISEQSGDFRRAVEEMNNLLAIRGRVLPVTTEAVSLVAETAGGERIRGELSISEHGSEIRKIWLEPVDARPVGDVLRAIDEAEIIVLGPGSLFTSVIPNLLISKVAERLRKAAVPKVYICNLMTQPGETDGFSVADHVRWIASAMGMPPDYVIANTGEIPPHLMEKYRREKALPLVATDRDREELEEMGCLLLEGSFVQIIENALLRHDGQALSHLLIRLCRELKED